MKNKRTANILVFTLAVMALLLRPYMAYQLTESLRMAKDQVAVNGLLQRLVKKKDDHHIANAGELSAIRYTENKLPPPPRRLQATPQMNAISVSVFSVKQPARFATVCPSMAYYKLFSTFRI